MKDSRKSFSFRQNCSHLEGEGYCPDCKKYSLVWMLSTLGLFHKDYVMCINANCEFYENPAPDKNKFQNHLRLVVNNK